MTRIGNIVVEAHNNVPVGGIVWLRGQEVVAVGMLTDRFRLPRGCDRVVISEADFKTLRGQMPQAERQFEDPEHAP